ncbi:hypothetical protein HFP57_02105 [Parasphingopyxis algicola]|uniref:hypothetical protein n=1 Tax=Parasphingopyxis algicola TaxID=2026624 RepID=UPI0015A1C653|nr:hypothetical protein [Parasphingopyxis algicola]QLC23943.1 hypothetical protein HFP57_02105 [Parasphingopyxis algicola]
MTIAERVGALIIRLSPDPICDDCITERLDLCARNRANQHTRHLMTEHGFERQLNTCALCGCEKKVIRYS